MEKNELIQGIDKLLAEAEQGRELLSSETGEMLVCSLIAPGVVHLLSRARQLLAEAEKIYETGDGEETAARRSEGVDPLGDIGAEISTAVAEQEIGDLAFLTGNQIGDCQAKLEFAIVGPDAMQMGTHTEIGLRRLRRGLVAMSQAICHFEGWEAAALGVDDLEEALEVRRFYWELRRIILGTGEPEDEAIPSRLRNFSAVIDAFRTRPVFSRIRIEDRIHMFRLCDRLAQWLDQGADRSMVHGRRLWQDMIGFANLLTEINNRQELREHDRDLIELALINIGQGATHEVQLARVLALRLRNMLGLDAALDRLILEPANSAVDEWEEVLKGLQSRIACYEEDLDREVFLQPPDPSA